MILALLPLLLVFGCSFGPKYQADDCPIYDQIEAVRVNPAGAPERHLQVKVAFRVCPPESGPAELARKRIELKHHLIALLSAKTADELEDPLRVEKLSRQLLESVNRQVLRKVEVVEVFITGFELE